MNLNKIHALLPKINITERLVLNQIFKNCDVALLAEETIFIGETSEDIFYDRFQHFLESQYDEMAYLCKTEEFNQLYDEIRTALSESDFWPNFWIGDNEHPDHMHDGTIYCIQTTKNILIVLKSLFNMHFGGYFNTPFAYDDGEHAKLHDFSNN